jgi:hypothetical protein
MITLCFTTLAAADLRRSQNSRKNSPRATAVRTVRLGLLSLVVLAVAAGTANAGGKSGFSLSGGNGGGGNGGSNKSMFSAQRSQSLSSSFGGSNGPKFDIKKSTGLSNAVRTQDFKVAPRTTIGLDKKIGIADAINKNGNLGIKFDLNKKIGLNDVITRTGKIDPKFSQGPNGIKVSDLIKKNNGINKDLLNSSASKKIAEIFKNKNGDHCQPGKCWDKCNNHCWKPCSWWNCWNSYPKWCGLYRHSCGYYTNVPVVVIREGVDLQLLAVRIIDSGDAQGTMGPAYRVWIRNNSNLAIARPFNVLLLAARDVQPAADLPQSGVRVDQILPGQVLPIDIRLPATANLPGLPALHVVVDSHSEVSEVYEDNNGLVIARSEVLPVEVQQVSQAAPTVVPMGAPNAGFANQGVVDPMAAMFGSN